MSNELMTVSQIASTLDGCEIMREVSGALSNYAEASGIVIVFGASDDLMEFRGAIYDEAGCCGGGSVLIDQSGIIPSWDDVCEDEAEAEKYFTRKKAVAEIEAVWAEGDVSWQYKTDIPHETFKVMEDGEVYCIGIVFALADIAAAIRARSGAAS